MMKGMRRLLLALLTTAAFAETAPKPLEVIRTIPHSGYSEGLDYFEGYLWHSLPKEIVKIDPADGNILHRYPSATSHGESLKWYGGKMIHVSFADNNIYVARNPANNGLDFKKAGTVPEDRAWGIEFDGTHLIVTGNYSDMLYFLSPTNFKVAKKLKTEIKDIEDLAWDGKRLWASSFTVHRGQIFPIDRKTGKAGPFYTLPQPESCPVIDGLAYDGKGLWITGKECPALTYVKLPQ